MTGTGSAAGVEGYRIGGKTGTAEKLPRDKTSYVVSFIGAAPIDNPQVVVYVVVDEPNVAEQSHSTYAQEIFSSIMEELLPYMNIYPTESVLSSDSTDSSEDQTTEDTTAEDTETAQQDNKVVVTETGRVIDGMNIDADYAAANNLDPNTGESLDDPSVLPDDYTGAADTEEDTATGSEQEAVNSSP